MIALFIFICGSILLSWIDWKKSVIEDKYILPLIFVMVIAKLSIGILSIYDLLAIVIVVIVFLIPIFFNMNFGGGDLRFGAFCALFVGLGGIGYFIVISGVSHLVLLALLRKKEFGFAPAMSIASVVAWGIQQ